MPDAHIHSTPLTSPSSSSGSSSDSSSDPLELGSGDLEAYIARVQAQCLAYEEETRRIRLQNLQITIYTQCMHEETELLRAMLDASDSDDDDSEPEPELEPEERGIEERARAAASKAWRARMSSSQATSHPQAPRPARTEAPSAARMASTSTPPSDTNTAGHAGTHQCENLIRTKNKAALRELAAALHLPHTKKTRVADLRTLISECFLEIEAYLRTQHPEFGR